MPPPPVDDEIAHPEIAVHQRGSCRRRTVGVEPPERPLERRRGVAHRVEFGAPRRQLVLARQIRPSRIGAVNGGKCGRALCHQRRAARVVEVALDAADDRLAGDLGADQVRVSQWFKGIRCGQDLRHRRALLGGQGLCPGLEFHAGMHFVGRAGAQDQPPDLVAGARGERPGGAAGAAGQPAQVLDLRIEYPAQHRGSIRHLIQWFASFPSLAALVLLTRLTVQWFASFPSLAALVLLTRLTGDRT